MLLVSRGKSLHCRKFWDDCVVYGKVHAFICGWINKPKQIYVVQKFLLYILLVTNIIIVFSELFIVILLKCQLVAVSIFPVIFVKV